MAREQRLAAIVIYLRRDMGWALDRTHGSHEIWGCQPARLRACFLGLCFHIMLLRSCTIPYPFPIHSLPINCTNPLPFRCFTETHVSKSGHVSICPNRQQILDQMDPNGTRCVDASTRCGDAPALNDWRSRSYTLMGFVYFVYFLIFLAFKRSNMKLPVSACFFSNLTATATAAPQ